MPVNVDSIWEADDGSRCPECGSTRIMVLDQTIGCADCPWVDWHSWSSTGEEIPPKPRIPSDVEMPDQNSAQDGIFVVLGEAVPEDQ